MAGPPPPHDATVWSSDASAVSLARATLEHVRAAPPLTTVDAFENIAALREAARDMARSMAEFGSIQQQQQHGIASVADRSAIIPLTQPVAATAGVSYDETVLLDRRLDNELARLRAERLAQARSMSTHDNTPTSLPPTRLHARARGD
jgi:hypothetical protein